MPSRLTVTRAVRMLCLAGTLAAPMSCRSPTEPAERMYTLDVAPARVPCMGEAPHQCLQVRKRTDVPYTLFYDTIAGFAYEPGYQYVIAVAERRVSNPPADGSDRAYRLVALFSKTAMVQ